MIEQLTPTPRGPGWSLGKAEGGGGRSSGQPCLSARIPGFEPQGQTQQEAGPQGTDPSGLRDVQEVQVKEPLQGRAVRCRLHPSEGAQPGEGR